MAGWHSLAAASPSGSGALRGAASASVALPHCWPSSQPEPGGNGALRGCKSASVALLVGYAALMTSQPERKWRVAQSISLALPGNGALRRCEGTVYYGAVKTLWLRYSVGAATLMALSLSLMAFAA